MFLETNQILAKNLVGFIIIYCYIGELDIPHPVIVNSIIILL